MKKVGLLGTRYTMQLSFYPDHLAKFGIETIIPAQEDVDYLNYTIYNEFSKNLFLPGAMETINGWSFYKDLVVGNHKKNLRLEVFFIYLVWFK